MKLPKKTLDSLNDIQKLVNQASPAIELARTLASIDAPAKADAMAAAGVAAGVQGRRNGPVALV